MAHRILRFSTESVWGALDGSPAFSGYIPCDNPATLRPMTSRPFWNIKDGTGLNVGRLRGSEIIQVGGPFTTRSYWENIQYFAGWLSRVNSGRTLPWPTDQRAGDYASMTVDFGWGFEDDTMKRVRYLGVKPGASARFECGNNPDSPFLMQTIDLIGGKPLPNPYTTTGSVDLAPDATAFPEPSITAAIGTAGYLPSQVLTFQECTFYSLGAVRNFFDRFSISISSTVKPYYDNGRFPSRIHNHGRTVTLTVHPLYEVATDPRTRYEAVQSLGNMSILFTNPALTGAHTVHATLKFDFRSNSFLDSVAEEMAMDNSPYADWTATALLDSAAGDDFAITYTPES